MYPKWLRRLFFGITGDRYGAAMRMLDAGEVETQKLREQLNQLSDEDDPLAALVRNVKSATFDSDGHRANH